MTTTTPVPRSRLARWAGLGAQHDFRQLWVGHTVTQVGGEISALALPVLAVTLLGADEWQMGVLAACGTAAFLVIGLPAGAWVDRWRRRRVLVVTDLVRAAAMATIPAAWALDRLSFAHLLVVALVSGTATVFFDVGYQSYLPSIVRTKDLGEGNAKLQASDSAAQVGGPALAGLLIRLVGAPLAVLVDAVTYLVSAAFLLRIRTPDVLPDKATRRPLRTEIAEGVRFVAHHPLLRRITACTGISNFFANVAFALVVLYALRELGLTEATLGVAFSAGAVGGLVGAATATALGRWVGQGRMIPVSIAVASLGLFGLPLAGSALPALPAVTTGIALSSFASVVYNITQVTFRQRLCPPALLGRMNASIRFVVFGTIPLGALVGGALGGLVGVRTTMWVAAVGGLLACLPVWLSPLLGMRDLPLELDAHADADVAPRDAS